MNSTLWRACTFSFCLSVSCLANSNLYSQEMRDPTLPLVYGGNSNQSEKKPVLQAILNSGDSKKVVIDGVMLQAGGTISGWKVISISDNSVLLSSSKGQISLKLRQNVFDK